MAEPVVVHQHPDETTRTANKSCVWIAETVIDGHRFTAKSRYGAVNELARQLVVDGVEDAPMHVYSAGLKGCLIWRSFYKAAERTIEKNDQAGACDALARPYRRGGPNHCSGRPKTGVKAPTHSPGSPRAFTPTKRPPTANHVRRRVSGDAILCSCRN